jgi:hypothetical protein
MLQLTGSELARLQRLPERFNRGSRQSPIIRRSFRLAHELPHGLQAILI